MRSAALPPRARIRTTTGVEVCADCTVAERTLARMKGLYGRVLEPGQGLLINPAPSVQTFFMRYPIDVVFLDRTKTVVGISAEVPPNRIARARGAVAALELPSGTAARVGVEVGDTLELEPLGGPERLKSDK